MHDEPDDWFGDEASSNDADGPTERHLEPVPPEGEWFEQSTETPGSTAVEGADSATAPGDSRVKRTRLLFAGTVAGILVVLVGGAWAVASLVPDDDSSAPESLAVPPAAVPVGEGQDSCESSKSADVVTGNGDGDTKSTAGVILAFQHAYYVDRDTAKVEPLLANDAEIRNLEALQEGIDSVDQGTTHCLRIEPDGESAEVELTETAPDGTGTVFHQHVTTSLEDNEYRLVSVTDASDKEN